ncbi:SLC45 family MFS transporter [Cryomorpha ignava]|uniref:SLC45 family MFS transporter n=2 Tax=Cryomorpha ignava TaxID=101383 RepID=A0A7K3WLL6_9FLAO|nr:SLC45 family MFS transporter [Cryomorpha ignava]
MSFGFLGIQFGFALQNANVSRIFETLGASKDALPILWLAAPVTGLLVQPIVGYYSDRTWNKLGRRRPFFLAGAILASFALIVMPNSPTLWIAAGTLWLMDGSINISMEPFRAFVGDKLPDDQRTKGFAMQSFFIGTGAVIASMLPYIFTNWFGVSNTAPEGIIPDSVRYSFYIGAAAFLGAVIYTIVKTKEYPPEDMEAFLAEKAEKKGVFSGLKEAFLGIFSMPKTMKQLAFVQFFSWFALFAMWIYTTSGVTSHIYGTDDTTSALYNEGADWVGVLFAIYNGVAAIFAFILPVFAKLTNRKITHLVCLFAGGIGLISIFYITDPAMLFLPMIGVGIAWSSILSMPYAMLAGALPANKMGYYMGVFNFFIVIPQIVAASILGYLLKTFFGNDSIYALIIGGVAMFLAGLLTLLVKDTD